MSTNSSTTYIERAFLSKQSPTQGISPCEELANAIVVQAVKDYRTALRGENVVHKSPISVIKDCEKFFRSDWYRVLTKVDGEMLIAKLREELRDES